MSEQSTSPRRSPLHRLNEDLGARFVDFGGWDMPVQFEGTLAEHRAVRDSWGLFDVSHLGRFRLTGAGTTDTLRRLLCNDITKVEPGRCQYTMMLTPDGGVVDDIIVWRLDDDDSVVLPNGVNHDRVLAAIADAVPDGSETYSLRESTVLLAVQGPQAPDGLDAVFGWKPRRFRVDRFEWRGHEIFGAGTGYTGERGGEIILPTDVAADAVQALLDAGAVPCGLGARDTLRLEMGFALWGQDLDETISPLEAELGWVVDWDHEFVGREALARQRDGGLAKRLVSFAFEGRTIPRHGYAVRLGPSSGTVASGNFSPSLGVGVGMAYLAPDPGKGDGDVEVEIRGTWQRAARTTPPFLER